MSVRCRPLLGLAAALLLMAGLPGPTDAQNPDLSGTWTLNTDKSELPEAGGGGRGRGGMMGGAAATFTLAIDGEKISITRSRRTREGEVDQTISFTTDGKAQDVAGGRMGNTSITASWTEGTLVVVTTMSFDRGGQSMSFVTTERYTISDDGAMLTIDGSRSSTQGDQSWKAVYDKK